MFNAKKALSKLMKTPMVVESGTSGIWTYRKWSDGIAELWGAETKSIKTGWSANYSLPVTFPFTFASAPFNYNVMETSYRVDRVYFNTATTTNIQLNTHSTVDGSFAFVYQIIGRWK